MICKEGALKSNSVQTVKAYWKQHLSYWEYGHQGQLCIFRILPSNLAFCYREAKRTFSNYYLALAAAKPLQDRNLRCNTWIPNQVQVMLLFSYFLTFADTWLNTHLQSTQTVTSQDSKKTRSVREDEKIFGS